MRSERTLDAVETVERNKLTLPGVDLSFRVWMIRCEQALLGADPQSWCAGIQCAGNGFP